MKDNQKDDDNNATTEVAAPPPAAPKRKRVFVPLEPGFDADMPLPWQVEPKYPPARRYPPTASELAERERRTHDHPAEEQEGEREDNGGDSGILRQLYAYCTANGEALPFAPTHVFSYRVEDAAGNVVITNMDDAMRPVEVTGPVTQGFHSCLLEILSKLPATILDRVGEWLAAKQRTTEELEAELRAPRTLTIVTSKGDAIFRAYTLPAGELAASQFKQKSGEPWRYAAWIARVLAEAEALGVTIKCRPEATDKEALTLTLVRSRGSQRGSLAKKLRVAAGKPSGQA